MAITYLDDDNLIAGLKRGEEDAFEALMNLYGDKILKLCYLVLKEGAAAEDATQEVFIQIYKNIHKFKRESALYTWIYKIALNKCRDVLKRRKQYTSFEESVDIAAETDVEYEVLNMVGRGKIKDLVFDLQPIYREVIILFYFEELSIKEIAAILEESENTIKSKLHRARNILKESIRKEELPYGRE